MGRPHSAENEERLIRRGAALTDKTPLDGAASLKDSTYVYGVSIDRGGWEYALQRALCLRFQVSNELRRRKREATGHEAIPHRSV